MERFISEECYNEIMGMAAEIVAEAIFDRIGEALPDAIEKRYPREKTQKDFNTEYEKEEPDFNMNKLKELGRRLNLHHKAEDWATNARSKEREHGESARSKQDKQLVNNQVIDHDNGSIEFISTPKNTDKLIKKSIERNKKKNS